MDKNHHSPTTEIWAEVLMFITSSIILETLGFAAVHRMGVIDLRISDKNLDFVLSPVFAIFLPLMSYMLSQAKLSNPARYEVILVWVVLSEVLRAGISEVNRVDGGDGTELKKSAEQVVRFLWVGFLVLYGYKPLNILNASILVLCVICIVFEVVKRITDYQAMDSYLIGKNPKLIHNYMKKVMLQANLRTIPMNSCDYIVMGEQYHEIAVCENGYCLGDIKTSNSNGKLTIGGVFQLNSSRDEALTLAHPDWRDNCLSFALAKMLRRRFINLPLDEAGSSKALDFVLQGLIDYIGSNQDVPGGRRNGERNSERVFRIIEDELKFVADFVHNKVPTYKYVSWRYRVDGTIFTIKIFIFAYVFYRFLFFFVFSIYKHKSRIYSADCFIASILCGSCLYLDIINMKTMSGSKHWAPLCAVERYIGNQWKKSNSSVVVRKLMNLLLLIRICFPNVRNGEKEIIEYSIFCIKARGRVGHALGKCIKSKIPKGKWIRKISMGFLPTVFHSTAVKDAILTSLTNRLMSLRNSGGQLTKGETALESHGMLEHLESRPSGGTTETILIWHIATTLFHHRNRPSPEQTNDPFKEKRDVALALSNYCVHLLAHLPELLPEEVEWAEQMYECVKEEIYAIDNRSNLKPTEMNRCNYAMGVGVEWDEKSVVGKGAKLATELMDYADNGTEVWTMLSEFWAEMMLFIAPSDNVEGHKERLGKGELITQVWALLTHAGILTRSQRIEVTEVANV